jgi:hypothetical protein
VTKYDRSSLRTLGTVGEPINPEAWAWYHNVVGGGKCNVVDTYWQTETGGHIIVSWCIPQILVCDYFIVERLCVITLLLFFFFLLNCLHILFFCVFEYV